MNDSTLQSVLSDLRPKLITKFHTEDMSKKSPVEVHRNSEAGYQFGFFFRKTEGRHVLLMKEREYGLERLGKKRIGQRVGKRSRMESESEMENLTGDSNEHEVDGPITGTPTRRSKRARRGGGGSVDYNEDQAGENEDVGFEAESTALFMEPDEEEEESSPELVRVKEEPIDDEDDLRPLPPPSLIPGEVHEMELAARSAAHRTGLGTGLEDEQAREQDGVEEGAPGSPRDNIIPFENEEDYADADDPEEDDEEEDEKKDYKPVLKLSYTGFTIHSRHLVLIVEPWPPIEQPQRSFSARPRSTFSRSMSRDVRRNTRQSNSVFDSADRDGSAAAERRSETPLVPIPNSRRGGTTVTPAPGSSVGLGGSSRDGARRSITPIANSRSGAAGSASRSRSRSTLASMTPFERLGSVGLGGRTLRSRTPLFREATPMSEAGDRDEFDDEDGEGEDQETPDWRSRAWSPWRKESEPPEGYDQGFYDDEQEEEEDVEETRGILAMSQSLRDYTEKRSGSVAVGGGADKDDGEAAGYEGNGGDDDMGGADY